MFERVDHRQHFPGMEKAILAHWSSVDIFRKSVKSRLQNEEYIFYDGPPFATGLPHYGHLLAGTIKDIVPRYQTMRGKLVRRRFGWDCHGLPVEMEMQNQLGMKSSAEIAAYGIGRFNEACRQIVLRYTREWEKTVTRLGRWVDFENDYKTMDLNFMESVWWVFKTLYDKGLIYEGFKVVPYSWKAGTSLSNFEANLNYRDVQDPAITVAFPAADEEKTFFLAWTTTPWTLVGNLALCVNPSFCYVKVRDLSRDCFFYLSQGRLQACYPDGKYEVVEKISGEALVGKIYRPVFPYASAAIDPSRAFRILSDNYIREEEGTGIVHLAPSYGEDDYRICRGEDIPLFDPVDEGGHFAAAIDFIAGENIKKADKAIIRRLKEEGKIFRHETVQHSYPYCWRTDTPLIYKAVSTWFVKVETVKKQMVENNQTMSWVPEHIKNGRFGKWIENARDWDIGRNRFWGTPIPIWKSETGEILCFGSVEELAREAGEKITDIHKHHIDRIILNKDGKTYKRVPQILDCWFESGSMPYAQNHYPFEKKDSFESRFPADFIAEGLDQTRGWFYTLLIISTCISQKPPVKNIIASGLILAEDGKKMSKRLKNYPDPSHIIETYGADALRMYMIHSAVVQGESLCFSEAGVAEVLRSIVLPLWNSLSFFVSYANIDRWEYREYQPSELKHALDRWILSYLEDLNESVIRAMDAYDLRKSVPPVVTFIDRLTNWYIRRSRRRFWKSENDKDKDQAYFTLFTVLLKFSKLLAPFMPFISEKLYLILTRGEIKASVHLEDYPLPQENCRDRELEEEMKWVERVVSMGRSLRIREKIKIRQPLKELILITADPRKRDYFLRNEAIITDELNVKELAFSEKEEDFVKIHFAANFKKLGRRLGSKMKGVAARINNLTAEDFRRLNRSSSLTLKIDGEEISLEREGILIRREEQGSNVTLNHEDVTVVLNTDLTSDLVEEGQARDFINRIQKTRKEMQLEYTDRIHLFYSADEPLSEAIDKFKSYIARETLASEIRQIGETDDPLEICIDNHRCSFKVVKAE